MDGCSIKWRSRLKKKRKEIFLFGGRETDFKKVDMIDKKTSVVVGPRRSFLFGNQRVIGSHAKWTSVIGHGQGPMTTGVFFLSFRLILQTNERNKQIYFPHRDAKDSNDSNEFGHKCDSG